MGSIIAGPGLGISLNRIGLPRDNPSVTSPRRVRPPVDRTPAERVLAPRDPFRGRSAGLTSMSQGEAVTARGRAEDAIDLALVERIARRDQAAFEALYRRYARRVGGFLWKRIGRRELIDEALNDVMLLVWEKAPGFEPRGRVSAWIFAMAHLQSLKTIERARRHHSRESPLESAPEGAPACLAGGHESSGGMERQMDRRSELRRVADRIEALPPDQRAVVELAFVEGHSYAEIAAILDCPVNTVKTRIFHARNRLGRVAEARSETATRRGEIEA